MSKNLLTISGSYRPNGITEQAISILAQEATERGWNSQHIRLIEKNIKYCTNCRSCTQSPGTARGRCIIQDDDVPAILQAVDQSDALVLAAPTNYFDVTAVTRTFLERLIPAGLWPWGQGAPRWRDKSPLRRSVLITSTAMPALFGRFFTTSLKALGNMSTCLRAKPVDRVFLGMIALQPDQRLSPSATRRLTGAAARLLA
ncbi:MAG: flavodoxin family protein [Bacillota bacterium]